jgi:hypothetical protein
MQNILKLIRENIFLGYKFNLDFLVNDEKNIEKTKDNKVMVKK